MDFKQDIKAIFFDIDGTYYDHKTDSIPKSNIKAVKQLQKLGYKTALATARPLQSIKDLPVFDEIQWDGIVCAGGQQVFNERYELIYQDCFSKEELHNIFKIAEEHKITVYAYGDTPFFTQDSPLCKNFVDTFNLNVNDIHPYQDEDIFLITFIMEEGFRYEPLFQHMPKVRLQYAGILNTDLFPKNATKASGIHQLMKYWNFNINAYLAFGDSGGDIEMIQDASIGVAMGNGSEACKSVADYVCGNSNEDGIYIFLKDHKFI